MRSQTSIVIELKQEMYHWMYLQHAIKSDCQTQLLNVFGQIAMYWEEKKMQGHSVLECLRTPTADGFGGLVVRMLVSVSRIRGFAPYRSRWIFSDVKKSSACLPSEGK
jgi:hypothetical protein